LIEEPFQSPMSSLLASKNLVPILFYFFTEEDPSVPSSFSKGLGGIASHTLVPFFPFHTPPTEPNQTLCLFDKVPSDGVRHQISGPFLLPLSGPPWEKKTAPFPRGRVRESTTRFPSSLTRALPIWALSVADALHLGLTKQLVADTTFFSKAVKDMGNFSTPF